MSVVCLKLKKGIWSLRHPLISSPIYYLTSYSSVGRELVRQPGSSGLNSGMSRLESAIIWGIPIKGLPLFHFQAFERRQKQS